MAKSPPELREILEILMAENQKLASLRYAPRLAGFQKIKDFLQVAEQGLNRKSLQDFPKFFLTEKTLEVTSFRSSPQGCLSPMLSRIFSSAKNLNLQPIFPPQTEARLIFLSKNRQLKIKDFQKKNFFYPTNEKTNKMLRTLHNQG